MDHYEVAVGNTHLKISARTWHVGDDLIFALHGFGCSSESFEPILEAPELAGFSICAIDFPSHGSSSRLPAHKTSLEAYAEAAVSVLNQIAPRRVYLVAHSMGAAVGLIASRQLNNLACFFNIEGNLVEQDCGIVSRLTAGQSRTQFVRRGFHTFIEDLKQSDRQDLACWAKWYSICDPEGLHQASRSLVQWSDSGELLARFRGVPNPHYVFGGQSELSYLLPQLAGIRTHEVPDSGHFPMIDRPDIFVTKVSEIIRSAASGRRQPRRVALAGASPRASSA
jgi:pimeloyl-ACP methyl ester carboxylesterase